MVSVELEMLLDDPIAPMHGPCLREPGVPSASARALRIGVVAPPWFSVPPVRYGGTEAVVSLLVEGLTQAGHEVTIFATGDSRTRAKLVAPFPEGRAEQLGHTQPELLHALAWIADSSDFDVISDHTGPLGLMLSNLTSTPFLHTVHGALSGEAGELYRATCEATPGAALVALTHSHRRTCPELPWAATIPNAIALADHPCRARRGGQYLLWLGRFSPDKGPVAAIEVARAAGMPLVLAGKMRDACERRYFEEEIRPRLDDRMTYAGEVDLRERVRLLHGARALVNPIAWDEPFGLVMVEAMACGVPVIAPPRGSVPEVVVHGRTGWIASTVDEMVAAVERCDEIDPRACRAIAERRFSPHRMVRDYVRAIERVIAGSHTQRGRSILLPQASTMSSPAARALPR
jgi:glycosyltransferase involved in cell wall biosynthesis